MSLIPFGKYLELDLTNDVLQFDTAGYVTALLSKHSRLPDRQAFEVRRRARAAAPGSDAHHIRGHTFVEVLVDYVGGAKGVKKDVALALCDSLFASCEREWLQDQHVFRRVATVFADSTSADEQG